MIEIYKSNFLRILIKFTLSMTYCFVSTSLLATNIKIKELEENFKSKPVQSIILADSLLLTTPASHLKDIETIKYYKALAFQYNNNNQKSIDLLNELAKDMDKKSSRYVRVLLFLSNSNAYLKNDQLALSFGIKALDIAKENKYLSLIASANSAISFIHYNNKDYLKSLEYLNNSVSLFIEENDSIMLSSVYNNIAIVYKSIFEMNKALQYNNKSLAISLALKDNEGIGKSYSNIGRIYFDLGKIDLALYFYNKAVENNCKANIKNSIPYRNIGAVYLQTHQYKNANIFFEKALEIENKTENIFVKKTIYQNLLKIAIKTNNFQKALNFQSKIDSLSNIELNIKNEEKILMLENQHKLYQNTKKLKQLEEINKKNKIITGVILSLVFVLILFFIQYTRNKKLKLVQEKIVLEQKVLRSQMNPHFIFNALSAIQNSLLDNDPIKSASYLSKFAKLIRQNFDFISQKSISLSEEIDALINYMDTQKLRFEDKFNYEINICDDVNIFTSNIPPLLIQPFIENAIEHGFKNKKEKGKIVINISKKGSSICYEIKDNGKGFNSLKNDSKIHSIDIFKKRLKLLKNKDEKTIQMLSNEKGTVIKFCMKQ